MFTADEVPTVEVGQVPVPIPEGVTVLDVREPVEWHHGRIEGSLHVPMAQIPARTGELPHEGQLLVVCKVGGRSAHVTAFLRRNGFDAVNLDGGLIEWVSAGRVLVGDTEQPLVV
jgi:rhodanese-related sulfurtransferase